jgi:hypothetical protein
MLIVEMNDLITENSDELDTPLSLSCAAENLRMAAFYFDKARNLLEHAALAVESSDAADLTSYIQSAGKYQAHAVQYSSIAKAMIT